jgi:adenine-specific DNA-methyltransferase
MTTSLKEQLKAKLKELFQFDSSDLDFGIYRIMNYKRKEIERFIEEELIGKIKEELSTLCSQDKSQVEEEFEYVKEKVIKAFGESALEEGELRPEFRKTPLGREYYEKKKLLEQVKISEDLEKSIYNHLINFFSRYYDAGDFISKRRYGKRERYCIQCN